MVKTSGALAVDAEWLYSCSQDVQYLWLEGQHQPLRGLPGKPHRSGKE